MNSNEKKELIEKHSPGSKIFKNSAKAFLFGGFICVIGELLLNLYSGFIADEKVAGGIVILPFPPL